MNKGGFSWKRLLGVSAAQSRISRKIGIPLSKSGRQQKVGRILTGGGCLLAYVWSFYPDCFACSIHLVKVLSITMSL